MFVSGIQLSNKSEQFIKVFLFSDSSETKLCFNLLCKKTPLTKTLLSVVSPSWFTFDKRGHCDNILKSGHICIHLPLRQKGSQGLTPEPISLQYSNYFNTKKGRGKEDNLTN